MRILSVGNFGTGWDGSICDEKHILEALSELGHTVKSLQREEAWKPKPWLSWVENGKYDFVLLAQWDGYKENCIDTIRDRLPGTPIIYWAFDHQADGQEWHERLVAGADLYLSKPFSDSKYPNWRWLSQDFAPTFLEKTTYETKDIDVLFTGSWVPWESGKERVEVLRAIDKRFNLQINSVTPDQWKSEGFKNVQGPVMDHDLPALIARAKINFSMDHVITPGYWSDRNSQILACGGAVLFKHVPMSESVFHDHVFYFYDTEDCLEKLEKLLKLNYNDLDEIGERNYQYAKRYLTVTTRVQDLLAIVEEIL